MRNLKLFAFVALALLLVVTACGGGETPVAQQTQPAPAATTATSGGQAAATQPAVTQPTSEPTLPPTSEPTVEPTVAEATPTEESADLGGVAEGLANLKSYKSTLDMRFTGTNAAGESVERSWSMVELFIADPAAEDMSWESSESTAGAEPTVTAFRMLTIGTTSYWIGQQPDGTESCTVITSQDAAPEQSLNPDMWGEISDATYTGTETVNGIRAKHYLWKDTSLLGWGLAGGKGETWVAADGGYAVRQRVEASGKDIFLGGSEETGTTTWEWNVTDVNGSFEILPPEGCESATSGLPIMADATEQAIMGDLMSYTSPSAFADVVDFYQAEMPKAGWQPSGEPAQMENFFSREFAKGSSKVSVLITWDDSTQKTSVLLSVTESE